MQFNPQSSILHRKSSRRAGFTLVEMLLAVSISVMVFFAMGVLLTKCFALWKDATANWRLAQYARISRERILSGGFASPAGGLLSATNATVHVDGGWDYVEYQTVTGTGGVQQVYGWAGSLEQDILIRRSSGTPQWTYGQSAATYSYSYNTPVKVDLFAASVSNDMVNITYRMRFSAAGQVFTQPHTIHACLVNKE